MSITRFKLGFAALVLIVAFFPLRGRCATATLTLAEQEVVEALLQQDIHAKNSKRIVIKETASVQELFFSDNYDSFSQSLRNQVEHRDQAFKEAMDDFLKKNKTPVRIVFPTNPPAKVELISEAALKEIFSDERKALPQGMNECWNEFYRRFPGSGGRLTISRVGFDSGETIAIIYLGELRGSRAGHGQIYVFRRENGRWILKRGELVGRDWYA